MQWEEFNVHLIELRRKICRENFVDYMARSLKKKFHTYKLCGDHKLQMDLNFLLEFALQ